MFELDQLYDICLAQHAANNYIEKHKDEKKVNWTFYLNEKIFKEGLETVDRKTFDKDIEWVVSKLNKEFIYVYDYMDDDRTVNKYKGEIRTKIAHLLDKYLIRM